jgi:hypothetical protein
MFASYTGSITEQSSSCTIEDMAEGLCRLELQTNKQTALCVDDYISLDGPYPVDPRSVSQ